MTTTFDIGVDVDDVLFPWSDLAHAACEAAGITNGKQVTQWEMHLDYGCERELVWKVINMAYEDGMLTSAPPIEGTRDVLAELMMAGHRVHLITARGYEGPLAQRVRDWTIQWLMEYDVPRWSLTFERDKARMGMDYFVDDSISNVTKLRAAGCEAYLHTRRHNLSDTELPRVDTLAEFASIIHADTLAIDGVCN